MAGARLDVPAFYAALNAQREERGLSWRQVAAEAGVGPSTLSRLAQGKRPDVDSFGALIHWLGLPAENFMRRDGGASEERPTEPAAAISSLLRAQKDVDPASADAIEDILRAAMRLAGQRDRSDG